MTRTPQSSWTPAEIAERDTKRLIMEIEAIATWDEIDAIVAKYRIDTLSTIEIAAIIWLLERMSPGPSGG